MDSNNYKWNCINSSIEENLVSWCETGGFFSLAQMFSNFNSSIELPPPIIFQSNPFIDFDAVSLLIDNFSGKNGNLIYLSSADAGGDHKGVWVPPKNGNFSGYLYAAANTSGIRSYTIDTSGHLLSKSVIDPALNIWDVWGDENFIYACNTSGGLITLTATDGIFSLKDINYDAPGNVFTGIWGDGNFIYCAGGYNGISNFLIDGSGIITYLKNFDDGDGVINAVGGDGIFIYSAASDGLRCYSVDSGTGTFTLNDKIYIGGENWTGIWVDENFIYVACGLDGIRTFSVDGSGVLTHIDTIKDSSTSDKYTDVWGDVKFIYATISSQGIASFSVNSSGFMEFINRKDQGGNYVGIYGNDDFIFTAVDYSGVKSYRVEIPREFQIHPDIITNISSNIQQ